MKSKDQILLEEAYDNIRIIFESTKRGKELVQQGKLSQEDLENIINADPTTEKKFVGWMATQWVNKAVTDIDELRNTVEEFNSFLTKRKTKSIYDYKTFEDLKKRVRDLNETGEGLSVKELESDFEVFKNDENLLVMIPHTHEASRKLGLSHFAFRDCERGGKDSAWCTTYKAPNHFNDYYHKYNVTFYYVKVKSEKIQQELENAKYGPNFFVTAIAVITSKGSIKMDAYDGLDKQFTGATLTKYLKIIGLDESLLVPRRSKEERQKNYKIILYKKIQEYIKNGSQGDLNLAETPITSLPEGLKVGKGLFLDKTPITSLPNGLEVGEHLSLRSTAITSLPEGLKVGGGLYLNHSKITSLPSGLKVGGDLYLNNTPITSLPNGLKVGENLYLESTSITSLPNDLEVGKSLFLNNVPITSLPEGVKVGRDLTLTNTKITSLPKGLNIAGALDLQYTQITSLPKGLKVGRNLYLQDTLINFLPEDLEVGGGVFIRNTPLTKYTEKQIKQTCPGIRGGIYK